MTPDFRNPRGVLFDLDGTLADTAPDLADALNHVLARHGREPLPFETIRAVVSHGGAALIRLGFAITPDSPDFDAKRQQLLDYYERNLCRRTRLFDGMDEVLATIEQHNIAWGIVTNKPAWLTDPLMSALGLESRARSIISGDTCGRSKPHPEPILCACDRMGIAPAACVYVGDAERDIASGRAAGTATVAALYGYLRAQDEPQQWMADAHIEAPRELLALLRLALPA